MEDNFYVHKIMEQNYSSIDSLMSSPRANASNGLLYINVLVCSKKQGSSNYKKNKCSGNSKIYQISKYYVTVVWFCSMVALEKQLLD